MDLKFAFDVEEALIPVFGGLEELGFLRFWLFSTIS